jgi:formylglycine-generating enzyme required for sulfatase activity
MKYLWLALIMVSILGCVQKTNKVSVSKTEKPPVVEKGPPGLTFLRLNEQGYKEYQNDKDSSTMVLIPAREFTMGSNDAEDEKPIHTVYLDTFYIDKYEVTVGQYRKFAQATGRNMPDQPGWNEGDDNYPVVNITWYDASAYASWGGKRLPTDAEWEKAARGTDKRIYPWGNTPDPSKCNSGGEYSHDRYDNTAPVGSFPQGASPYGVMDMAGNVWEWCSDWYNYYQKSPSRNPTGPSSGSYRVIRGGSFALDYGYCRTTSRDLYFPEHESPINGFRCVR